LSTARQLNWCLAQEAEEKRRAEEAANMEQLLAEERAKKIAAERAERLQETRARKRRTAGVL
jgi:hypothetical protein